jgi:hypothetical protein
MDAIGARELRRKIEERQHWQQAEAVRDGRQSRDDPDADRLLELGDGLRIYDSERSWTVVDGVTVIGVCTLAKRLVNGWWEVVTLDAVESRAHTPE